MVNRVYYQYNNQSLKTILKRVINKEREQGTFTLSFKPIMTIVTILDSQVQYYVEDNQTYWHVTDVLKVLRGSDKGHVSFARKVIKDFPDEFTIYKNATYTTKLGVYKLIKHFRTENSDKLYTQITKVADAALDAGFMDGNNFLSVAPKSEYIAYHQSLGSAVSSLKIAACFGKSHKIVLRDFEVAIQELEVREHNFAPTPKSQLEQGFQKINSN